MNSNDNTTTETNFNKKPYQHQSTTPYKNYQHHNNQHKTPKDKFRPLGFSSPYQKSGNPDPNSGTPFKQYRNYNYNNRNNYSNNNSNRNNHHHNNQRQFKNNNREENISQYFHPSMIEDPWKKLEERAEKVKQASSESDSSSHSSVT